MLRRQVLRFASYVFPPLRLANHLLFLFSSGRDGPAPPTLALRLAGLAVVADGGAALSPSSSPINYAYAYRRVLLDQTYRLAQALLPAFRHLAALPRAARAEAAALLARRIRNVRRLAAVLRGGESRCGPAARAAGVTVAAVLHMQGRSGDGAIRFLLRMRGCLLRLYSGSHVGPAGISVQELRKEGALYVRFLSLGGVRQRETDRLFL